MNSENSVLVSRSGNTTFRRMLPKCYVCLDYIREDECKLEQCKHRFHDECLVFWIAKSGTCPVCRAEGTTIKHQDGSKEVVLGDETTLLDEINRDEDMEPPQICNLCEQEVFYDEAMGRVTTCLAATIEHEFHMDCLAEHFINEGTYCPMCGPEKKCLSVEVTGGNRLHYDVKKKLFFYKYIHENGIMEKLYIEN